MRKQFFGGIAGVFLVWLAGWSGLCAGAEPTRAGFVFGVLPYHSARVLIAHHRPVVQHLRGDLGGEVRMETAASFRAFQENSSRGDYDLVATAAHFARLLQLDHDFVPLVRLAAGARCNIVVRKDSEITRIEQLAGKLVATPDRLALGTVVCLHLLEQQGLRVDRDFRVQDMATFNSAALAVERGDAPAAVSAPAALLQMRPEERANLRSLVDTAEYTNLVYLAHPRVGAAMREKIKTGLLRFSGEPEGRAFFTTTGFGAFVPVTAEAMQKLDPYVNETRRLLLQR
jgi:ABC-type phosphate/phosphonate transport system substrate-binding protein